MYRNENIPVLSLYLDAKNPRFILPDMDDTQGSIRKYLLEHEDALALTKNIVDYGGLMPGERIVATIEDGKYIVLEGNRRTCACQILVDRSIIPDSFVNKIPPSSDELVKAINNVDIDIISTREEARRFLATRHIERTREWSTIAKMRFCFEDYELGNSISQIRERTGLSASNINKYIRNYKILIRGLEGNWSSAEKNKLFILDIKPDKLIRIFGLADTKRVLQLYFDDKHQLQSNLISKDDIDDIIHVWTRKAFIDNEMDTRTPFGEFRQHRGSTGACGFIEHILVKYFTCNVEGATVVDEGSNVTGRSVTGGGSITGGGPTTDAESTIGEEAAIGGKSSISEGVTIGGGSITSGGPSLTRFFSSLAWNNVKESEYNGRGVIAVCKELVKISNSQAFINSYPVCTAFIIRALIEQSIKYYAKEKSFWPTIMQNYHNEGGSDGDPKLSFIIKQFKSNIATWIPDNDIRRLFNVVFNQKQQVEKFNLVIHSPELYTLSPETLKAIPDEGLLAIANYFLS